MNFVNLTQKPGRGGNAGQEEAFLARASKDENSGKSSNLNLISEINTALSQENDTDQTHFYFLNGYV